MAKIDSLFKKLMEAGGSDLHLKQGAKPRSRVHGLLQEMPAEAVLALEPLTQLLKEIVDHSLWETFEKTGDLDFAYAFGEKARFRANYFRHTDGYGAIFRIIPAEIRSLEQLGMPASLNRFAHLSSGLVLVTGPTGSGKSTTLAAMIDDINAHYAKKIVTIEEPVEFIHANKKSLISHREVGFDTETFASGLKTVIKSDVNIILVGEMRDQETIRLALSAAEMGILVFGTLHTNSAAKTIDRIIDVFPTNQKPQIRTTLANVLKGVVSQQLLRNVDGKGRCVAYEILMRTQGLNALIQSGETVKIISEIQLNRQSGMILMDDSLRQLVAGGKVSREEALKKAFDKTGF